MKLPQLTHFPWRSPRGNLLSAVLHLEGFKAPVPTAWWTHTTVVIARSRCRLRWFRLPGISAAERLAALRLQAEAWRPFDHLAARLVLSDEGGLVIAWDAEAVQQQLLSDGLTLERCQLVPETLTQPADAEGLRLLRCADGFEAQSWQDGFLTSSRWWPDPLTERDWQEFVHASGASRAHGQALPEPQQMALAPAAWARHYPLHATADGADGMEPRLVLVGALALTLATGAVGHQLWDVHRQGQALARQIAELKTTAGAVLTARDTTMAAVDEVQKLATWFELPQPIDVIGHLHEVLGKSGMQIKDLDLEGDKLRLNLQLTPQATRAGIVKDLQSGGWLVDVAEVRADNARGLLSMEMRINGPRPPVTAAPVAAPAPFAEPVAQAAGPFAPAAPVVAAPAVQAPTPAPVKPPQGPPQPIFAKPDAQGMPPPEVFRAIPNR